MRDLLRLALGSVFGHRLRSLLSMVGIAIGIASVILLTSIGEGTRRYMMGQFTQFGTNLIAVHPGKTQTSGLPGVFGGTTRKLTLDDALAVARVPGIEEVVPVAFGSARLEANGRSRSLFIYGVTPNAPQAWKLVVRQGGFWPAGDPQRGAQLVVLGPKAKSELFGEANALGRFVRIAGTRFRVIGVMGAKGQLLGFDINDSAYVPVASAMKLFNLSEVNEIDVVYTNTGAAGRIESDIRRLLNGAPRQRGLLGDHPGGHAGGVRQRHEHGDPGGRSHRRDLAPGGSHRHPHHDVDRGGRADVGDRPRTGDRGDPQAGPPALPD
jgi:putative ABC transport system permease protein